MRPLKLVPPILLLFCITAFAQANKPTATISTISGLVARIPVTIPSDEVVSVLGYTAEGDWGAPRVAKYVSSSVAATNLGCVFMPVTAVGRWVFQDCESGEFDIRFFGGTNTSTAITAGLTKLLSRPTTINGANRSLYLADGVAPTAAAGTLALYATNPAGVHELAIAHGGGSNDLVATRSATTGAIYTNQLPGALGSLSTWEEYSIARNPSDTLTAWQSNNSIYVWMAWPDNKRLQYKFLSTNTTGTGLFSIAEIGVVTNSTPTNTALIFEVGDATDDFQPVQTVENGSISGSHGHLLTLATLAAHGSDVGDVLVDSLGTNFVIFNVPSSGTFWAVPTNAATALDTIPVGAVTNTTKATTLTGISVAQSQFYPCFLTNSQSFTVDDSALGNLTLTTGRVFKVASTHTVFDPRSVAALAIGNSAFTVASASAWFDRTVAFKLFPNGEIACSDTISNRSASAWTASGMLGIQAAGHGTTNDVWLIPNAITATTNYNRWFGPGELTGALNLYVSDTFDESLGLDSFFVRNTLNGCLTTLAWAPDEYSDSTHRNTLLYYVSYPTLKIYPRSAYSVAMSGSKSIKSYHYRQVAPWVDQAAVRLRRFETGEGDWVAALTTNSPADVYRPLSVYGFDVGTLKLVATDTTVVSNQFIGKVEFVANDGSSNGTGTKAWIGAISEGVGGNGIGLSFAIGPTTVDAYEAMHLDRGGNLKLGVGGLNASGLARSTLTLYADTTTHKTLTFESAPTAQTIGNQIGRISFYGNDSTAGGTGEKSFITSVFSGSGASGADLVLGTGDASVTNAAERVRILSTGALSITSGLILQGTNQPTAPTGLSVMGAHLWSDGTNFGVVLQNSAGTLTTNKVVMTAW